ncbi:MAG: hypothetical protein QM601_05365, partial [Pseudoxanthomonas sp.]
LAGGGTAAWLARGHRAGAALTVAALASLAAIALAAWLPFPAWLIVACLASPLPLGLGGIRLATPPTET